MIYECQAPGVVQSNVYERLIISHEDSPFLEKFPNFATMKPTLSRHAVVSRPPNPTIRNFTTIAIPSYYKNSLNIQHPKPVVLGRKPAVHANGDTYGFVAIGDEERVRCLVSSEEVTSDGTFKVGNFDTFEQVFTLKFFLRKQC